MNIKISILIPTFNRVAMVCEALDLIIKYDCPEVFEVIVSDNHSTDGTLEKLAAKYESFKKLKLTKTAAASGPLSNWQHALSLASGTHVHWHWSDDYLCGPFYEKAAALMKKENADVIISPVNVIHDNGTALLCYEQKGVKNDNALSALKKLFIDQSLPVSPAACILPIESVRKHFYLEMPSFGIYDPIKYAMGTDALMIAGSLLDKNKVFYLEEALFCFRKHDASITEIHADVFPSYFLAFEWFIRKEKIKIPLSLRRWRFGVMICNTFEKKYSRDWFTGIFLERWGLLNYKIKMFLYVHGINLFKKKHHLAY